MQEERQIFFIESSYIPTAASTNRLIAYAKYLVSRGVRVSFYYLFPDKEKHKSSDYTDIINFVYLWENRKTANKYINTYLSLHAFLKLTKPEIPVYVYSSLNCIHTLRKKNGIRLYQEFTENPEVVGRKGGLFGDYLFSLYKKSVSKLEGLFVITPALKRYYVEKMGVSPNKIEIVNMIVDPERFKGYDNVAPEDYITYCGIVSINKDGVSNLINSFALIANKHQQYKLRIIGPYESEEIKSQIQTIVNNCGLEDRIEFTGSVSHAEMPRLLCSSKILALSRPDNSQSQYGFPTKLGEYLMTERPVVMTKVGNVEDYLTHQKDAILAEPDNVEDFAEKLEWVIDNYTEASEIGKRGKDTALRHFNPTIEAAKIYNKLFGQL